MRYLILSDIHANHDALDAVLAVAPRDRFDGLLVLGDVVGYGAEPNRVIDTVRGLRPDLIVRGNHDKVASGVESAESFNDAARLAALWTLDQLTDDNRAWLEALPPGPAVLDDLEVCHGTPDDEDEYVLEPLDALQALRGLRRDVCFFGHTHVAIAYWLSASGFDLVIPEGEDDTPLQIEPGRRYLINPGSVGQPRDGDPRAAYGVYDHAAHVFHWHRVTYDVAAAQTKILAAGLPSGLARRLAIGR